jgi:hypothetical protein
VVAVGLRTSEDGIVMVLSIVVKVAFNEVVVVVDDSVCIFCVLASERKRPFHSNQRAFTVAFTSSLACTHP